MELLIGIEAVGVFPSVLYKFVGEYLRDSDSFCGPAGLDFPFVEVLFWVELDGKDGIVS